MRLVILGPEGGGAGLDASDSAKVDPGRELKANKEDGLSRATASCSSAAGSANLEAGRGPRRPASRSTAAISETDAYKIGDQASVTASTLIPAPRPARR